MIGRCELTSLPFRWDELPVEIEGEYERRGQGGLSTQYSKYKLIPGSFRQSQIVPTDDAYTVDSSAVFCPPRLNFGPFTVHTNGASDYGVSFSSFEANRCLPMNSK